MAQAKTLNRDHYTKLRDMLGTISSRLYEDRVILSLSFKAGLRVAEIAGLRWEDVCNPFGTLQLPGEPITVPSEIAKKGSARRIPMHPELYADLRALIAQNPANAKIDNHIVQPARSWAVGDRVAPNTLQRYMGRLFRRAGLRGMSSHSGRRSFGTALARQAGGHDCSLRDVQGLLGHKFLQTTESYIDPSEGVKKLVTSL